MRTTRGLRVGSMEVLVLAWWLSRSRDVAARGRRGQCQSATAGTVFGGVFVQALPFLGWVGGQRIHRGVRATRAAGAVAAAPPPRYRGPRRRLSGGGAAWVRVRVGTGGATSVRGWWDGRGGGVDVHARRSRRQSGRGGRDGRRVPGQPKMVMARVGASLLTAVVMGWVWSRWGRPSGYAPATAE